MVKYVRSGLDNNKTRDAFNSVKKYVEMVASQHKPRDLIVFFMQVLFSYSIYVRDMEELVSMYMLDDVYVSDKKKRFTHISSLKAPNLELQPTVVQKLCSFFPCVTSLDIGLNRDGSSLDVIRKTWGSLEVLHLSGYLDDHDLTQFFFNGKCQSQINKMFIENKTPSLSFPKLKRLLLSSKQYVHHDFMGNLLYYYTNLDVQLNRCVRDENAMSDYQSYVGHNIALNSQHALSHCDIRLEDLRLNCIVDTVLSWDNLQSITFLLTEIGGEFISLKMCLKKLKAIFKGCTKFDSIAIDNEMRNPKKYLPSLLECFQVNGHKIKKFVMLDSENRFKADDLLSLINQCPNLQCLFCCMNLAPPRFPYVIQLPNLKYLSVTDTSNLIIQSSAVTLELVKRAPELYYLCSVLTPELSRGLLALDFSDRRRVLKTAYDPVTLTEEHKRIIVAVLKHLKVDEFIMLLPREAGGNNDHHLKIIRLPHLNDITIRGVISKATNMQFPFKWEFDEYLQQC